MEKRGGREGNNQERNEKRRKKYTPAEEAAQEEANRKLGIVAAAMAYQGYINEGKLLSETRKAQHSKYPIMGFIKNLEGPKGRTSIMYAASIGDLERFHQLVEAGANVTKEDDMFNVLTYAATGEIDKSTKHVKPEHSEIIRYLVQEKGIPVDKRSGTYEGYPNSGVTPLMVACVFKHFAAVKTLCELGADVNARAQNGCTPILSTCNFEYDDDEELPEEIKLRIKFDDTSKHIIDYLLTQGANINDVDDRGTTCLMRLASVKGNIDGLFFLLSPSYKTDPTMLDNLGNSALAYACDSGDADHINILGHSINPNTERNHEDKTLLMRMASGKYPNWQPSLKALLDLKDDKGNMLIELEAKDTDDENANVKNKRTKKGLTALNIAAQAANVEAVRALCEAGADVNTRSSSMYTPLTNLMFELHYHKDVPDSNVLDIIEILLSHGANPYLKAERDFTLLNLIHRDNEHLKAPIEALIQRYYHPSSAPGGSGNRLGGGGAGTQGGGSRKARARKTRGKGKKAKSKTRKARS